LYQNFSKGFLEGNKHSSDDKLPPGPGRYTGYLGFHADRAAGKYGRKKSGLLTIEPVAGTFPARVLSSGKIRKKFQKNPRSKKNQNFSGRSRDRLS
jgi:hypothetical protein